MASSKPVKKSPEPVEWDLSESFGILPEGLSLTHNLGCVRSPSAKKVPKPGDSDPPNSKK
jgi:hypothetical protein